MQSKKHTSNGPDTKAMAKCEVHSKDTSEWSRENAGKRQAKSGEEHKETRKKQREKMATSRCAAARMVMMTMMTDGVTDTT